MMRALLSKLGAAVLLAALMAPVSARAECVWGDSATPEAVFAQACRAAGGCPSGCSCNPCGGNPITPPDPRAAALARANQRLTDLLWRWKNDFYFQTVDDWQSSDRSSEAAFFNVAERLDRAFIDQMNHFDEDRNRDEGTVTWVNFFDGKIRSYRHNIAILDGYLASWDRYFNTTQEELNRLTAESQLFRSIEEQYRLKRDRDRLVAVEALSVYLPKGAVRLDAETVNRYAGVAAAKGDGEVFPYQWKTALAIPYPPSEDRLDKGYLVPSTLTAMFAGRAYNRLPATPEDAVAMLEADEQRAVRAFQERNDYLKAHPEKFEYESKQAEVERLGKLQAEKQARIEEFVNPEKGVIRRCFLMRQEIGGTMAATLNRATESLVWEMAKTKVINRCKKVVAAATHTALAKLSLSDDDILDKYLDHAFNVFGVPESVSRIKELKTVQNDMLTLLKEDQKYAQTAVGLAVNGDQSEVNSFVEGMFAKLDENGTKLMEDAFKASLAMPEPARTLVPRYFVKSFRNKLAGAE